MKSIVLILSLMGSLFIEAAQAQMKGDSYHLPAVDVFAEKSAAISAKDVPLKYALSTPVDDIYHINNKSQSGKWTKMFDGSWEFTLRLIAKNATSLNVGMKDFFLPPSAELWVSTDNESILRGPYDGSYNQKHGYFWVGDVPADHMNIRISVSNQEKKFLSFKVDNVTRGFYKYWEEPSYNNKSGNCNVDVACPEGDGWESQINSVGRYTFIDPTGAGALCTGQLINNTRNDGKPYFLTASHCGYSDQAGNHYSSEDRQNTAASIALIWNYQSLTCRMPNFSQSGNPISTVNFNDRQSGAIYRANNSHSDFALVELNQTPLSNYGVEYTGWDRRNVAPSSAVTIHHPSGHAKRISIENDSLSVAGYYSEALDDGSHLRVTDWDFGTTEGGSSGAGLWNSEQLLVGTLHGGGAACGNDEPDWYGRFYTSWDHIDSAESRLKDWLDPIDTGQETLQSFEGCEAPIVEIVNESSNTVGDLLTYSSNVTGGTGAYSYVWDINGDSGTDGTDASIQARYNHQFVGNISLTVTDSMGCATNASQAVVIINADVQLEQLDEIEENLSQVCGNNDGVIDPGERWKTVLNAQNRGALTGSDAYLTLSVGRSTVSEGDTDNYGNTVSECDRQFIDITSTGTLIPWETAGTIYPADDEGSVLVQLSQSFDHYGQSVNQLRASTNGYFSTSATATGSDWTHDCPLPATLDADPLGGRIAPMHLDMNSAKFYHQTFSDCPRTAETGSDLACEVFMWKGADVWSTSDLVESLDVQAILYPQTSQWVYQYAGDGIDGIDSTTGMQNALATDGLTYACDTANSLNTNQAVCTYNKNYLPGTSPADYVKLESPVISLADMDINDSKFVDMEFAISEDTDCGVQFSINHEATVYDEGFNAGQSNILSAQIGNNGQCNVVNSCEVGTSELSNNDITPRRGFWWNPDRNGNGLDLYQFASDYLIYYFYTADKDGEPEWLLADNSKSSHNHYRNDISRYSVPGGFNTGNPTPEVVGWSNTSFIDDSTAIQVRMIDGQLSAEKQYFFQYAADETPNMHTGPYYTPSEAGWGHSIGTLGNARAVITYIYDHDGNPYWTIGNGPNDDTAFDVNYANTFCPSCPAVAGEYSVVGSIKLTLDGQHNGTLDSYNVSHEDATWNRANLPIESLIPPSN